jgi:hypothetical protein
MPTFRYRALTAAGDVVSGDLDAPWIYRKIVVWSTSTPRSSSMSSIQPCPLSRERGQSHAGRRLLRTSRDHPPRTRKDQAPDNRKPSLAASTACRIISIKDDPKPPFRKPAICLKSSDDGHVPRLAAFDLKASSHDDHQFEIDVISKSADSTTFPRLAAAAVGLL